MSLVTSTTKVEKVDHPALRYFGGKWRLSSWIIEYFPEHDCYVEPYAGAASVLMRKTPSQFEVYNDMDGEVVNFFRVLRERPRELFRALKYSPYSREEFEGAHADSADPVEWARRFFVRAWQGYGGPRKQYLTGWKIQSRGWHSGRSDQLSEWNTAKQVMQAARRFRNVQIERDDALRVIQRFDKPRSLFYCDPPYPATVRNPKWMDRAYNVELGMEDHVHLANLLKQIKGVAIVSSYPSELYDELYAGWLKVSKTAQTMSKTAQTMNKTIATEVIYVHPRISSCEA